MRRILVLAVLLAACSSGAGDGDVDGPVTAYRIVYEVEGGGTETVTVQRPFLGRVDTTGGAVRVSDAGVLATSSNGAPWVRIEIPISLAIGDLRGDLLDASDGERRSIAGRTCRVVDEWCVDDAGLVLADDRRTAVEVDIGDVDDDLFAVPADAMTLSFDRGGGAVERVDVDDAIPFAEAWTLPSAPSGFDHVGRWAVAPPPMGGAVQPVEARVADVALVTDAWVDGADVLLLDQGASVNGAPPPWETSLDGSDVSLGPLGEGTVVVDPRMNEVRVQRPEGGFVRLAGTLPADELVRIARTLEREARS